MARISDEELAYEIATNRSYLRALERRLNRKNPEISVTANERYVDNVPRGERTSVGPLCGRVGLAGPDRDLGVAFYIGTRYLNSADWDYPVINWAARAAKAFFDPHTTHELDTDVVVRRTLTVRGVEVVHASDDWAVAVPADQSPFKAEQLQVPPAPPRRQVGRSTGPTSSPARAVASADHPAGQMSRTRRAMPPAPVPGPSKPGNEHPPAAPAAPRALVTKRRITDRLPLPGKPADLATWQPHMPLIVAFSEDSLADPEGIAAVRAVDLVRHLARKRRRVLVVSAWNNQIPKIVNRIHTAAALVGLPTADIPKIMTIVQETEWLVGLADYPRFTDTRQPSALDVGLYVKGIAEQAVHICHRRLGWEQRHVPLPKKLEVAYEVIRMGGVPAEPLKLGRYSTEWIATLPPYRTAWGQRRYLALFAQLVALLKTSDSPKPYGHVIVHGEHEFSSLSCAVLRTNNPAAQWTVLTDLTGPETQAPDRRRTIEMVERFNIPDIHGRVEVIAVRGARLIRHTVTLPTPKAAPATPPRLLDQAPDRQPEPNGHVQRSTAAAALENGMRAVDAVRYALRAPRTEVMTSVLATLQPDQYRLVTQPPTMPLVIQGHPGTGKTIIAVHRAGYLVNEETAARKGRIPRVLLLGPTEQYVRHVSRTVRELDPTGAITVKSLPEWLAELAGLGTTAVQPGEGTPQDVGGFIVALAKHAVAECRNRQEWQASRPTDKIKLAYEAIRSNDPHGRSPVSQTEQRWIETLPPFPKVWGKRRHLPLLAQLGLLISDKRPRYDHIVVDEAQDVSELEWEIIHAHNADGRWTIVGDLNQRRRLDIGHLDWHELAGRLHILPDARLFEPEVVERGYRSTQPILDFANRLLPSNENQPWSLQTEGPDPSIIRTSTPGKRDLRAVVEASRLLDSYPGGTAAIITTDPDAIDKLLLSNGWRRADTAAGAGDWAMEGRRLAVRTPDSARGVEFDGVVVVEPRYFVRQEEFAGTLYTSLTRANRELVVVHSKPLPAPLARC
ncbi:AAA family ATPase [Micromonospora wenchangensis]